MDGACDRFRPTKLVCSRHRIGDLPGPVPSFVRDASLARPGASAHDDIVVAVRPQNDSYPEAVETVLAAVCAQGLDAGVEALEAIKYVPRDVRRRPSLARRTVVRVLRRDHFHCRYCGGKTLLHPISRLLGTMFPDGYPYHPNWKAGLTHPAIIARTSVVDHVVPGTQGGSWTDLDNMVTACWPCNTVKADLTLEQIGWRVQPITGCAWDGLVTYYRQTWEIAGRPDEAYHADWLLLLESVTEPEPGS